MTVRTASRSHNRLPMEDMCALSWVIAGFAVVTLGLITTCTLIGACTVTLPGPEKDGPRW